jgi:H+/gluconate symporter-like permease
VLCALAQRSDLCPHSSTTETVGYRGDAMGDVLLIGIAVGAVGGAWVGFWFGQVWAAHRAGRNTYRSVRGKR